MSIKGAPPAEGLSTFGRFDRRIQRYTKWCDICQHDPDNISCVEIAIPENIVAVNGI